LYLKSDDEFVKHCASQSVVFSIVSILLYLVLSIIPALGTILSSVLAFIAFLIWTLLIARAYGNIYYRLPVISKISEKCVMGIFDK
ncbi:MAG: hypothetical protein Q4B14_03565, partial [Clostridia bacterium]|nr:hypothetical protein [Clostridia bacterium]